MTNQHDPIKEAEREIQNILLNLAENLDVRIDAVEVDFRRFANMAVSIHTAQ